MEGLAPVHLVQDEPSLDRMLEQLEHTSRVSIDTEFHAEHRYRPELMLVQIGAPNGEVWILDPRAIELDGLKGLLSRAEVVVHGGQQDVELLARSCGAPPRRVFDTQRAAALLGMGYPTRLGTVVQRAMGVTIAKTAGLTDWSIRPLSVRQLQYAAEDARVLLPLAAALERRLSETGRLEWAWMASQELTAEIGGDPPELDGWRHWEIAASLDDDERRALHALFAWREVTARGADQPPRQILSDALALDLARRRPAGIADLAENRRVPQGLIKRHGPALLMVLKKAGADTSPAPAPPTPEVSLLAQLLEHWGAVRERDEGLARALVLPRPLALRVAAEGAGALKGWRQEALGSALGALLSGDTCMSVRGHTAVCIDHNVIA